jgi:hypothetical protein
MVGGARRPVTADGGGLSARARTAHMQSTLTLG